MTSELELTAKMQLFDRWLQTQVLQNQAMLMSLCAGVKNPEAAIRLKYGGLEVYMFVREAFSELMLSSIEEFAKARLGETPEGEEQEE